MSDTPAAEKKKRFRISRGAWQSAFFGTAIFGVLFAGLYKNQSVKTTVTHQPMPDSAKIALVTANTDSALVDSTNLNDSITVVEPTVTMPKPAPKVAAVASHAEAEAEEQEEEILPAEVTDEAADTIVTETVVATHDTFYIALDPMTMQPLQADTITTASHVDTESALETEFVDNVASEIIDTNDLVLEMTEQPTVTRNDTTFYTLDTSTVDTSSLSVVTTNISVQQPAAQPQVVADQDSVITAKTMIADTIATEDTSESAAAKPSSTFKRNDTTFYKLDADTIQTKASPQAPATELDQLKNLFDDMVYSDSNKKISLTQLVNAIKQDGAQTPVAATATKPVSSTQNITTPAPAQAEIPQKPHDDVTSENLATVDIASNEADTLQIRAAALEGSQYTSNNPKLAIKVLHDSVTSQDSNRKVLIGRTRGLWRGKSFDYYDAQTYNSLRYTHAIMHSKNGVPYILFSQGNNVTKIEPLFAYRDKARLPETQYSYPAAKVKAGDVIQPTATPVAVKTPPKKVFDHGVIAGGRPSIDSVQLGGNQEKNIQTSEDSANYARRSRTHVKAGDRWVKKPVEKGVFGADTKRYFREFDAAIDAFNKKLANRARIDSMRQVRDARAAQFNTNQVNATDTAQSAQERSAASLTHTTSKLKND